MSTINFTVGSRIETAWLNDVDALVWDVFGGATTVAAAKAVLGLDSLVIGTDVQAWNTTGPDNASLTYYETVMRQNMRTLESTLGVK